jgi:hypothetical protein
MKTSHKIYLIIALIFGLYLFYKNNKERVPENYYAKENVEDYIPILQEEAELEVEEFEEKKEENHVENNNKEDDVFCVEDASSVFEQNGQAWAKVSMGPQEQMLVEDDQKEMLHDVMQFEEKDDSLAALMTAKKSSK